MCISRHDKQEVASAIHILPRKQHADGVVMNFIFSRLLSPLTTDNIDIGVIVPTRSYRNNRPPFTADNKQYIVLAYCRMTDPICAAALEEGGLFEDGY